MGISLMQKIQQLIKYLIEDGHISEDLLENLEI